MQNRYLVEEETPQLLEGVDYLSAQAVREKEVWGFETQGNISSSEATIQSAQIY